MGSLVDSDGTELFDEATGQKLVLLHPERFEPEPVYKGFLKGITPAKILLWFIIIAGVFLAVVALLTMSGNKAIEKYGVGGSHGHSHYSRT